MSVQEVYTAIRKSNEEKCYAIVYLINSNRIPEATTQIQSCFECNEETAVEVAQMIKMDLDKAKSKNDS